MWSSFTDSKDELHVLLAGLQAMVPGLRLDEAIKKLANDHKATELVYAYTLPDLRPGVQKIFDLIEMATPKAAAVLRLKMLVALFRENEAHAAPDYLDLPPAVAMAMGSLGPHQDALNQFATRRRNHQFLDDFKYVADQIVTLNCVEALSLLRGAAAAESRGSLICTPIHALSRPFQIQSGAGFSPQMRLQKTLEFMRDEGFDLNAAGLMHKAARFSPCVDALVVLLDLGLDPNVKDERNRKPEKLIKDKADRDQWVNVVHSFKARRSAHQWLEDIEADSKPPQACP